MWPRLPGRQDHGNTAARGVRLAAGWPHLLVRRETEEDLLARDIG
jgi:hypothetical protein